MYPRITPSPPGPFGIAGVCPAFRVIARRRPTRYEVPGGMGRVRGLALIPPFLCDPFNGGLPKTSVEKVPVMGAAVLAGTPHKKCWGVFSVLCPPP